MFDKGKRWMRDSFNIFHIVQTINKLKAIVTVLAQYRSKEHKSTFENIQRRYINSILINYEKKEEIEKKKNMTEIERFLNRDEKAMLYKCDNKIDKSA